MTMIGDKLQQVRTRIVTACTAAGRDPASVRLLAVSKTFDADAVRAAHAAGQRAFGENYVQEGVAKIEALADLREELEWHCIGPLQSNKTRVVAEHFDWVHSIDRLKIAQRLAEQRPAHLPPLSVCLQVNVDGGANKSGVAPEDALALAQAVAALPRLRLRGLMAIPEPAPDFESQRALFQRAAAVFEQIRGAGIEVDTLSLGMSADLEAAVAAGSTMVRIGTAIFGQR
ncbi:YggS family pyridoxal phosphate-dependent enzyme [Variovorax ginsengisoli]|jgi:pyridoxal phosphate enzyme (YggS family)|uniref:Pyridoxal phosphate homeostasis protein n=1 Tax=Variovorax ginsengisoli TaxID=363844 RepID=A0ABT8RZX6_9BURK|nr:YggS family pyridoxal phosphate-dependent enzyme [Variovorax ginsengisoli]MDN8613031.1 YggS family pyridoxal phosphate-dependent enzyme [Variovorax ginsengisoli]MDO1532201.1 YggS family pyridoxal phosphate-dependent enzyme [Variovorax ginsengisoli]